MYATLGIFQREFDADAQTLTLLDHGVALGRYLDQQLAVVRIRIGDLGGGQMVLGVDLQYSALGFPVRDVLEGIEVHKLRLADIVQNDAVDPQLLGI